LHEISSGNASGRATGANIKAETGMYASRLKLVGSEPGSTTSIDQKGSSFLIEPPLTRGIVLRVPWEKICRS